MLLEQLKYFISVSKHLSFTEASKELYVTQPTVSNQIAKLEKELGIKLFSRNKQTISITPAGETLLKEAQKIIDLTDQAIINTRKVGRGKTGKLKIGALSYAIKQYLPSYIPHFQQKHPEVEIDLVTMNAEPLRIALMEGVVDIGITLHMSLHNTPQIESRKIATDNIALEISLSNPIVNKPNLKMRDLAKEHFITLSRNQSPYWYDFTMNMFSNRGICPIITQYASNMQMLYVLAENNLGIGISSRYAKIPYKTTNLQHIELEGCDTMFDIVIAWNKDSANSSIKAFLDGFEFVSNQLEEENDNTKLTINA